ncbi:bifunctional non-homologous end joining protein LigD [Robertmurraya siralis]|uniref:DNA ligase (ATP) n=1 Tax=Robertmurraya siralis TaxID=77777 RepID=A0A919WFS8_9BACI|nr:DNA ligase D [Robertmurraya siralis]GIN60916.1 bifunctional non-homologous end joining protein LigD [Robertmurraya siralis]
MKPMLPTLTFEIPEGKEWKYEVKYDGFRALLTWNGQLELNSRNGKPLLSLFPEISEFLKKERKKIKPFLPMVFDGEIVFLENDYKSNFNHVQTRGRMRSQPKIAERAEQFPCRLLLFDVIVLKGKDVRSMPYSNRKQLMESFFQEVGLPTRPDLKNNKLVQMVPYYDSYKTIWDKVTLYDGEGVVAKKSNNVWEEGKRTTTWLKLKNWKYVSCFITSYEKSNGYFYVGVYEQNKIVPIGQFLFGITPDEKQALYRTLKENKINEDEQFVYVTPAICVQIKYLEFYEQQLREPHFDQFRFDLQPTDCTYERFLLQQKTLPAAIEITHPNKPLWEKPPIQKHDYIHYLREIAPHFLPFLRNRLLTVIRYPHGIFGESFYQKNTPDYAPPFVETKLEDGINYTICNNLQILLWLGNQLAFEFHIPFQAIGSTGPSEIVFDLDPPSKEDFHLAIKAALMIKEVTDHLELISFIKTSGNKGLQIYLPLPDNLYSYEDTRLFTSFIADYLVSKDPDSFTIERMKKNRGNRLYIDYIQHAEGKTIIAPYSLRGTTMATVATPLFWEEVSENLTIEQFQMQQIIPRLKSKGDPFRDFFQAKKEQRFDAVLRFLKGK